MKALCVLIDCFNSIFKRAPVRQYLTFFLVRVISTEARPKIRLTYHTKFIQN